MFDTEIIVMLENLIEKINVKLPQKFALGHRAYKTVDGWTNYVIDLVHTQKCVVTSDTDEQPILAFIFGYCLANNVDAKSEWKSLVLKHHFADKTNKGKGVKNK